MKRDTVLTGAKYLIEHLRTNSLSELADQIIDDAKEYIAITESNCECKCNLSERVADLYLSDYTYEEIASVLCEEITQIKNIIRATEETVAQAMVAAVMDHGDELPDYEQFVDEFIERKYGPKEQLLLFGIDLEDFEYEAAIDYVKSYTPHYALKRSSSSELPLLETEFD